MLIRLLGAFRAYRNAYAASLAFWLGLGPYSDLDGAHALHSIAKVRPPFARGARAIAQLQALVAEHPELADKVDMAGIYLDA